MKKSTYHIVYTCPESKFLKGCNVESKGMRKALKQFEKEYKFEKINAVKWLENI